jgi:hypothetical protein
VRGDLCVDRVLFPIARLPGLWAGNLRESRFPGVGQCREKVLGWWEKFAARLCGGVAGSGNAGKPTGVESRVCAV